MRLTNRGRVVCGLAATGAVMLAQQVIGKAGEARDAGPLPSPAPGRSSPALDVDVELDGSSPKPSPSRLLTVAGTTPVGGHGPLRRYRVQVEGGIGEDPAAFASAVQRTLIDERSWGARLAFQRVESGPVAFAVVLASPTTAQRLCRPLDVDYRLSCFQHGRSVIDDARWRTGADAYADDLAAYRTYVVNHEVGHALGHHHEDCEADGALAPVMMQQTKGIDGCRPNPWPFPAA